MKKQYSYQKPSFIFIETIVSLLILSIIVSGLYKLSYNKDSNNIFQDLNTIHNQFNKNFNLSKSNKTLTINFDNVKTKSLIVKQQYIKNKNFMLVRYEKK